MRAIDSPPQKEQICSVCREKQKANKKICSFGFFGRIYWQPICFRFYLTFRIFQFLVHCFVVSKKMLSHKTLSKYLKLVWRLERVQNQHLLSVLYACFSFICKVQWSSSSFEFLHTHISTQYIFATWTFHYFLYTLKSLLEEHARLNFSDFFADLLVLFCPACLAILPNWLLLIILMVFSFLLVN